MLRGSGPRFQPRVFRSEAGRFSHNTIRLERYVNESSDSGRPKLVSCPLLTKVNQLIRLCCLPGFPNPTSFCARLTHQGAMSNPSSKTLKFLCKDLGKAFSLYLVFSPPIAGSLHESAIPQAWSIYVLLDLSSSFDISSPRNTETTSDWQ